MADVISGNRMEAESSADKSILDDVQLQLVPITAVMQPMIFCRTLIQVGFEPLEPVAGKSLLFRKHGYYYPNIFAYMNHIRKVEGVGTLFTGLSSKIGHVMLSALTERSVNQFVRRCVPYIGDDAKQSMDRRSLNFHLYEMVVCCTSRTAAIVAAYPFHVVMVRMIGSVVNKDEAYSGIISAVKEIYNSEGLLGFYSGFVPKWLAEMITVTLGGAVMYSIYRLMDALDVTDESVRTSSNYSAIVQFGLSSLVYRYQLTATVTAATSPGLHIGLPAYPGWRAVLADLSASGQLSRGSSYFYRKAVL